jgi:hypothetical protein
MLDVTELLGHKEGPPKTALAATSAMKQQFNRRSTLELAVVTGKVFGFSGMDSDGKEDFASQNKAVALIFTK